MSLRRGHQIFKVAQGGVSPICASVKDIFLIT